MKADNLKPAEPDFAMLARVLVMPGAADLFDAFARIPPGALRQSVITHAQVIAATYAGAPAEMQMPDPLLTAAGVAAGRPALPKPAKEPAEPKTDDPLVKAVLMRKKGMHPQAIGKDLGIPRSHVEEAIKDARKAGVKFPNIRNVMHGRPLEEKQWARTVDDLAPQGRARVEKAALARGLDAETYLARRNRAVEMAQQGFGYADIAAEVKDTEKNISLWLSNARAAGIVIPYAARPTTFDASVTPPRPPVLNVIHKDRWFGPFSAVGGKGRKGIEDAAKKRGMTPDAYLDLQNSIVRRRLAGVSPTEIARHAGVGDRFVYDTMSAAKKKGAVFPAVTQEDPEAGRRYA